MAASFSILHDRLLNNEEQACAEVYHPFAFRLLQLASPRIVGLLKQKVDPEDIVQSAFHSFFQVQRNKEVEFDDWNEIWGLLVTITLRKCRFQARHYQTDKRDLSREAIMVELSNQVDPAEPTPFEVCEMVDLFQNLMEGLDVRTRQVAELMLEKYSADEIGLKVGLTERSVYRQLKRIKVKLSMLHFD